MIPNSVVLFSILVTTTFLLSACSTTQPHMIPAPAIYQHPEVDLYQSLSEDLKTTDKPVFYFTNRKADKNGGQHYLDTQGKRLVMGRADVRLGEDGWSFDDLLRSDGGDTYNYPRPGKVKATTEFGAFTDDSTEAEAAFIDAINAQIDKSSNKKLAFYVHGYRVFFDEATVMMASWSHYLGGSALVTFQWPTGQHFWNYLTDCPRAEKYIPDITRSIVLLSKTKAKEINLLAYSCGSPLMAKALHNIKQSHPEMDHEALRARFRISNVSFVASDVDLKTFAHDQVPAILELSEQTNVYFSRNDGALRWSGILAGASRLGRPNVEDLSPEDISRLAEHPRFTGIDVSNVEGAHEMGGMTGHGYWYANGEIATDVLISLLHAAPPNQRCLSPSGAPNIWLFPDGYVDCVAKTLLDIAPWLKRQSEE